MRVSRRYVPAELVTANLLSVGGYTLKKLIQTARDVDSPRWRAVHTYRTLGNPRKVSVGGG